jgi:hypothetical protein
MTDLNIVAKVTRSSLSLGDLDINDHSSYVLAGPQAMGGTVQWDRKQVSAPWVDGDITVARRRQNVMDTLSVYVKGSTQADMDAKIGALIAAFCQDRFTLMITVGSQQHAWDCEAADYSVQFDTVHLHALYAVTTFQVPRKPVALSGSF